MIWDCEGDEVELRFSRKLPENLDWETDEITFEIYRYDDLLVSDTVRSVDLCYAVAKACTEVLKTYGFYGYRYSTMLDCFNIFKLLYIKSVALGNFETRELHRVDSSGALATDFEKEIELLLFDM